MEEPNLNFDVWNHKDIAEKLGLVRIVVFKGMNGYHDNRAKLEITFIGSTLFLNNFVGSSRRTDHPRDCIWGQDEIHSVEIQEDLMVLLKDQPNGFYEIIGDFWGWHTTSYEGESDGGVYLENTKFTEICYDHAFHQEDSDVLASEEIDLLASFIGTKQSATDNPASTTIVGWTFNEYRSNQKISAFMSKRQILERQASAMEELVISSWTSKTYFPDKTEQEIEDFISLMELHISSESKTDSDRDKKLNCIMDTARDVLRARQIIYGEEV